LEFRREVTARIVVAAFRFRELDEQAGFFSAGAIGGDLGLDHLA
jgi:hypothetical protein